MALLLSSDRDTHDIRVVYLATLLLGIAYGVSISLTALHLDARGFSKSDIGALAAVFALGIVVFSLPMGRLIERFSAKRTLLVALVGYACAVSSFPWMRSWSAVAVPRFFDGAFSVGIWVSFETILLARAASTKKASVTSLYAIALSIGYVVGPIVAKGLEAVAPLPVAFGVSGLLALAAAAVVLLALSADPTRARDDAPPPLVEVDASGHARSHVHALTLLARIKCSCFATFAYGYFQASVVLFLPLYLVEQKGITRPQTILVPAFFAAGMLLFSNVAGRIGDRFGHLRVMRVLGFVGMWMIVGFVFLGSYPVMCAAVFVAGATLASISPVSLALQGVIVPATELGRSNSIYNVFYAAGMLLGPPVSSLLFQHRGGEAMLEHLAALWLVFVAFAWVFRKDDPAVTKAFRAAERGSPSSAAGTPV